GRGTGVNDAGLARKVAAVRAGLAVNREAAADPVGALAALGGLEIAGLVGVVLEAAARRRPVLLDGFIAGAAALVATALAPACAAGRMPARRKRPMSGDRYVGRPKYLSQPLDRTLGRPKALCRQPRLRGAAHSAEARHAPD